MSTYKGSRLYGHPFLRRWLEHADLVPLMKIAREEERILFPPQVAKRPEGACPLCLRAWEGIAQ
jgi:hypothetical protein